VFGSWAKIDDSARAEPGSSRKSDAGIGKRPLRQSSLIGWQHRASQLFPGFFVRGWHHHAACGDTSPVCSFRP
jgi:hypothetical protein